MFVIFLLKMRLVRMNKIFLDKSILIIKKKIELLNDSTLLLMI